MLLLGGCGVGGSADAGPEGAAAPVGPAEFAGAMQSCLADAGWAVTVESDGGISSEVPIDQADAFGAAHEQCLRDTGFDAPPPPMDRDAAESYLVLLDEAAACLREAGYAVPEPPSRETSLNGLMSAALDPGWDLYEHIPVGDAEVDAREACPIEA